MARRVSTLVVFGILMAAAASLAAAAPVTLILKSGDRVSGDLIDMNASGFVVRVREAEQRFAAGDVAAIAFSNAQIPAAETSRIQEGRAFVVLNSGDTFYGSLAGHRRHQPAAAVVPHAGRRPGADVGPGGPHLLRQLAGDVDDGTDGGGPRAGRRRHDRSRRTRAGPTPAGPSAAASA